MRLIAGSSFYLSALTVLLYMYPICVVGVVFAGGLIVTRVLSMTAPYAAPLSK